MTTICIAVSMAMGHYHNNYLYCSINAEGPPPRQLFVFQCQWWWATTATTICIAVSMVMGHYRDNYLYCSITGDGPPWRQLLFCSINGDGPPPQQLYVNQQEAASILRNNSNFYYYIKKSLTTWIQNIEDSSRVSLLFWWSDLLQ